MNLHKIHGELQQTSYNKDAISGEESQVNALLSIIETLQAQSEGLSVEQKKTIKELKGRVNELSEKQIFLERELLAEKKKSAELKKQHEAQEKARIQQEQARLEAAKRANEEKRRQLEAKKAQKREELLDIQNNYCSIYNLAKTVFDSITTGNKFYRSSSTEKMYPEDHFMSLLYKGTEIDYYGKTIHVYEIWSPTCEPSRFQSIINHFNNVMNYYKNLYDETKRQRDAIV